MSAPAISIVAVAPDDGSSLERTLRHLSAQTIRDRIELVLVVPRADDLGIPTESRSGFAASRVVESGPFHSAPRSRALGVRAARAPFVAFSEEHSFPEPGWAEALLDAHREGAAAVGPELENANPWSRLSWANLVTEYGEWMGLGGEADVAHLPGHNGSYRRELLLEYGDELERMLEAESVIHWDLARRGLELRLEPRARTAHLNMSRWGSTIHLRLLAGRGFAAARAREWPLWRRLIYIGGAPLIPVVRLVRHLRVLGRLSEQRDDLPAGLAGTMAVTLGFDGLGELLGYLLGPPDPTAVSMLEFYRMDHLSQADRRALEGEW